MQRSGYGYVVTVLGATIGAVALGFGFGFVAAYIEIQNSPNDGWAGLMGAVVGGTVGTVVGSGVGAWLALRWRGYERAAVTGWAVAILGPACLWLAFFVTSAICRAACDGQATLVSLAIGGFVMVAAASRWVATRVLRRP